MPVNATLNTNASINAPEAFHDFIPSGDEEQYARTLTTLISDLAPEGILEQTFTTEIMAATWRLRRCRLAEEALGSIADLDLDPMLDERTELQQRSVDRARSQSHLILRRSIAELRKLQTQRTILLHANHPGIPSLTDLKQVANTLKLVDEDTENVEANPGSAQKAPKLSMAEIEAMLGLSDAQLVHLPIPNDSPTSDGLIATEAPPQTQDRGQSFCNPAPKPVLQMPGRDRNAPCPCGSGAKFKRCCGLAPVNGHPLQNQAA